MPFTFDDLSFGVEYCVCCLIFLLPLKKRSCPVLRITVCLMTMTVCSKLFFQWVTVVGLHRSFSFWATYAMAILTFWLCSEQHFWNDVIAATCAFAVQHLGYATTSFLTTLRPELTTVSRSVEAATFFLLVPLCYFLFARRMGETSLYTASFLRSMLSVVIVLPFAFFLSMLAEEYYQQDPEATASMFLLCRLYAILCCTYVLWIHTISNRQIHTQMELRTQRLLTEKQKEQYEISRDNIELINRKCHDLKHQVARLRSTTSEAQRDSYLSEIEQSVMIYDSVLKVGNDALDTILTERSLSCEREGIVWTCMADGACLSFMDPIDLYTLFGNTLDNAMESVRKLEDPEKRVITVTLHAKGSMAILQIENYYEDEIRFQNGLPMTSKGDTAYHGFGMRSIQATLTKYDGSMSITTEQGLFRLCMLLPIPQER